MNEIKREIRRVLLGYISISENYIVATPSRGLRLLGVFNGSFAARVLGLARRVRHYALPDGENAVDNAFANLGRRIVLDSAPDCQAVLLTPFWFNPSVLTAQQLENGELELCFYTAFSLSAGLNARQAIRRWRKLMPAALEERTLPTEKKKRRKSADSPKKAPLSARLRSHFSHKTDAEDD